jgi:hypothetical protein
LKENSEEEKMKTILIVALALFATAYAYDVEDIPEFMRERLDRYVTLKKTWEQKWIDMTADERAHFETVLFSRLSAVPDSVKTRIHSRIEGMEPEDRIKLRNYLYQRFPELEVATETQDEIDEFDVIIEQLPQMIREKISDFIAIRFAPAAAYQNVEDADLVEFPEIPDLVDIPAQEGDAVPYSEYEMPEDCKQRLDNFLLKREDWKRRWENLPAEKQEAFRKYIDEKLEE